MVTWTDVLSSVATCIAAIAAIVAGIYAVRTYESTLSQVKSAKEQTNILRKQLSPNLIITGGTIGGEIVELDIRNIGGGVATDIQAVYFRPEEDRKRFTSFYFEDAILSAQRTHMALKDGISLIPGNIIIGDTTLYPPKTNRVGPFSDIRTYQGNLTLTYRDVFGNIYGSHHLYTTGNEWQNIAPIEIEYDLATLDSQYRKQLDESNREGIQKLKENLPQSLQPGDSLPQGKSST